MIKQLGTPAAATKTHTMKHFTYMNTYEISKYTYYYLYRGQQGEDEYRKKNMIFVLNYIHSHTVLYRKIYCEMKKNI